MMTPRSVILLSLFSVSSLAFGPCGDDEPTTPAADGQAVKDGQAATTKGSACVASCTTAADCPANPSGFTYTCEGGLCLQNWCTADADCKVAALPHCVQSSFAKQCMPAGCTTKTDCKGGEECQLIFPGYKGCIDGPASCTSDTQCTDSQGTLFSPGHTKCQDGYCGCESDSGCQTAKQPLLGGTWKCVAWSGTFTRLK